MNNLFHKKISRRDFLKLNLTAFAALALYTPPHWAALQPAAAAARVTAARVPELAQAGLAAPASGSHYSAQTLLAANRLTFGPRLEDLDWIESNGVDAFIDQQLAFEAINDLEMAPRLEGLNTLQQAAGAEPLVNAGDALSQLQQATLLRAVYSQRQLFELTADFWNNHFNINARLISDPVLKTLFDRDVVRKYALGNFRDLLGSSAHHPAVIGNYTVNTRFDMSHNEYFARELLENQTIGLNSGYSEKDVAEITRAFTGWSAVFAAGNKPVLPSFNFITSEHDFGQKVVLGQKLPPNDNGDGEKDGEFVLDLLANSPACATFISSKLAQRFVADNPPSSVVQLGASAFQSTHGDIRATLGAILHSAEFKNSTGQKVKRPFEYLVSVLRILNAKTDGGVSLQGYIQKMGQPLFTWDKPGGFPDSADAWMNTQNMMARWNFARAVVNNSISGTQVDLSKVIALPGNMITNMAQSFLGHPIPADMAAALLPIADAKNAPMLAALLFGSPLFQVRN